MKKHYKIEPLTLEDMRRGKWNKRLTKRVVAPKFEKFFDCRSMGEWEARWAIVGLVVFGALLIAALLTLDQPPI